MILLIEIVMVHRPFFRELVSALSNRHSYVIEDLRKEFFET